MITRGKKERPNAGKGASGAIATHQEETRKEMDALMPSVLDKAFKGEL